ncbi:hypothetical protein [Paucibacter sp. Y2R2-4]|uniref:hypothetical protein n=1 Tax=Paucibacter sp. Y2R2-4 TaxID=2893553 RepID=UPI0021E42C20|nr:hypothetical protein [Paucibacter sp. Y2R2-4]MCV2350298.1 hypothetical protein [Paucibacter sp. Y2R2-4]
MNCPYKPAPALHALNAAQSADLAAMQAFYQGLSSQTGCYPAPDQSYWIAAEPSSVRRALMHLDLGVRPPGQAVPEHLLGSQLGGTFAQWLRMREDARHAPEKDALLTIFKTQTLKAESIERSTRRQARQALNLGWSHWQWASLPATVGELLGVAIHNPEAQQRLLQDLRAIARALQPLAERQTIQAADQACVALREALGSHTEAPLWKALQAQSRVIADTHAQALSLLWQSYEAGAALLGQALLTLELNSTLLLEDALTLLRQQSNDPGAFHHTRRWAQQDCEVEGAFLKQGVAVLLLLVGDANDLAFGHGRHQCPGESLAMQIGACALQEAQAFFQADRLALSPPTLLGFENLANARIPILATPAAKKEDHS